MFWFFICSCFLLCFFFFFVCAAVLMYLCLRVCFYACVPRSTSESYIDAHCYTLTSTCRDELIHPSACYTSAFTCTAVLVHLCAVLLWYVHTCWRSSSSMYAAVSENPGALLYFYTAPCTPILVCWCAAACATFPTNWGSQLLLIDPSPFLFYCLCRWVLLSQYTRVSCSISTSVCPAVVVHVCAAVVVYFVRPGRSPWEVLIGGVVRRIAEGTRE